MLSLIHQIKCMPLVICPHLNSGYHEKHLPGLHIFFFYIAPAANIDKLPSSPSSSIYMSSLFYFLHYSYPRNLFPQTLKPGLSAPVSVCIFFYRPLNLPVILKNSLGGFQMHQVVMHVIRTS